MDLTPLLVLIVLAAAVLFLAAPLGPRRGAGRERRRAGVADLEAARDAKYREIRDAELDHRTGKLSEQDWRALDRALRAEAIDILRRLDRAREGAAD